MTCDTSAHEIIAGLQVDCLPCGVVASFGSCGAVSGEGLRVFAISHLHFTLGSQVAAFCDDQVFKVLRTVM